MEAVEIEALIIRCKYFLEFEHPYSVDHKCNALQ